MDIKKHLNLILEKYELNTLYIKFITISIITTIIKESFYWALLYLSDILQTKPDMLPYFSGILIGLYGIHIPLKKYCTNLRNELIIEIRMANLKYFNDKIINIKKDNILGFDLVEYYNSVDHFNDYFQEYIVSQQIKYDIPIRVVTLIVIALNKKFSLLVGLFAVFYSVVTVLNKTKIIKESQLTKNLLELENKVRNYMINSKQFIINDEFNKEYVTENIIKAETTNKDIFDTNNTLDMQINIMLFIFIIVVIYIKKNELTPLDFFYYFLIIYDIEFIADKVNEYHKNKINFNRMKERLNYLNNIKQKDTTKEEFISELDNTIVITNISNDIPKLSNKEPIVINQGEHILVQGESGSGKTSLLYLLKGMLQCNELIIKPNIKTINTHSYIILSNYKSIFSGKLYDIISNYQKNPNIDNINEAIVISKLDHKFLNGNEDINIDRLSGGERIRVIIARLIYLLKGNNQYNILLFDEIDENLNNKLAIEVATNLLEIFNDKTILYITHNENVKKIFNRIIHVKEGLIL